MWQPTTIQWGFGGWASEQAGIVRTNICSQYTLYIMYVINQYERSTGSYVEYYLWSNNVSRFNLNSLYNNGP